MHKLSPFLHQPQSIWLFFVYNDNTNEKELMPVFFLVLFRPKLRNRSSDWLLKYKISFNPIECVWLIIGSPRSSAFSRGTFLSCYSSFDSSSSRLYSYSWRPRKTRGDGPTSSSINFPVIIFYDILSSPFTSPQPVPCNDIRSDETPPGLFVQRLSHRWGSGPWSSFYINVDWNRFCS